MRTSKELRQHGFIQMVCEEERQECWLCILAVSKINEKYH